MHVFSFLSLAVTMAAALPAGQAPESALAAPQVDPGRTRNDLKNGGTCPKVIFIYARGSNEDGNLVSSTPSASSTQSTRTDRHRAPSAATSDLL